MTLDLAHTKITLAPKLKVAGHFEMVDVREIPNLFEKLGYKTWDEKREIRMIDLPILERKSDNTFECLQNPMILALNLKYIKPSHIYCFVMDSNKHSDMEIDKIKAFLLHLYSGQRDRDAAKLAIKELFYDPVLISVFQENFVPSGGALTVKNIVDFFDENISESAINRIKRDCGATTPRKDKNSPQSIPEKWDSHAKLHNAPTFDEVMCLLKTPEKTTAFEDLVRGEQLEEASARLSAFLEKREINSGG